MRGVDELQKRAGRDDEAAPHLEASGGDRPETSQSRDHPLGLVVVAGFAIRQKQGVDGAGAQEHKTSRPPWGSRGSVALVGPAGLEPATRRL